MKRNIRLRNIRPIIFLTILSIALYFFVRLFFFFQNPGKNIFAIFYSFIFLIAETFIILHGLGFVINIFRLNKKKAKTNYNFKGIALNNLPEIAVVMPVKNEPKEVVEQTIKSLIALDYQKKNIYLLEGSTKENFLDSDRVLTQKYNINLFLTKRPNGNKASSINDFLVQAKEEFLAIFDADQRPMPSFLNETVKLIEYSDKIAFVQTPQFYSNIKTSTISKGAAFQQDIFFGSICEAKGSVDAMFCCGTNVLIRKKVLEQVGGFDENSVTEDFSTSLKIHILNYKSIYYNHVRAFGMAPENLAAYFTQQSRWASGTISVLPKVIKNFILSPRSLTISQWWEYFLSSSFYLTGWAFFLLITYPIMFILFNTPAYFIKPIFYIGSYIPYYVATSAVFYSTMKQKNYKISDVYHGSILSSLIFPVLMISTLNGLLNKKIKFQVTPKNKSNSMPFIQLWPWTIMIAFCILAIIIGILKFSTNPYAYGVNIFWCLYHVFILSHIYYFNYKLK